MKSILILALSTLFFCGSCKKEEPEKLELPTYSQDGKNILACKINGNIFIAQGKQSANSPSYGIYYGKNNDDGMTDIYANEESPFDADISIDFMHLKDKNFFILNNDEHNSAYLRMPVQNRTLAQTEYYTNSINTGNVKLLYYENNIIAGTFEFDAVSDYGDTVHVTEGRFDLSTQ